MKIIEAMIQECHMAREQGIPIKHIEVGYSTWQKIKSEAVPFMNIEAQHGRFLGHNVHIAPDKIGFMIQIEIQYRPVAVQMLPMELENGSLAA